jgi:predicted  nucleic acid-binding Zn-ribbon protein
MLISEERDHYQRDIDARNAKTRSQIATLEAERQEKRKKSNEADSNIMQAEYEIEGFGNIKAAKLAEYHTVMKQIWTGSETCPTCGQELPAEQVETARAAFNLKRSTDLETLKADGLALKKSIEEMQTSVDNLKEVLATLKEEIAVLDQRIIKGQSLIKTPDFNSTDEYKELMATMPTGALQTGTEKIDALTANIRELQGKIDVANRAKLVIEQAAEQKKRVDELKAKEQETNAELNKWELAVSLCSQHVKNSAKALETAVNGKFKIARFRLFDTQKNGEEVECCDIIYPNGSTNLSTGERLQTGVDIINVLSAFYGVTAPIFVDNAESVTLPYGTESQLIRLVVSPDDKMLRVEIK